MRHFSNIIGIDDAPFDPTRGSEKGCLQKVTVVGAVYGGLTLHGVMLFKVAEDGDDATWTLICGIKRSKFWEHIQLVMLQGIALAGFNVVDVPLLSTGIERPVLVIARKAPSMCAIEHALRNVRNGAKKLSLIEAMGPMEPLMGVYVQRYGLSLNEARETIRRFSINGLIPEPIRVAHLIGGAISKGISGGRA